MITIQTQSDGVLFNFQDSTRYLYGDGSILTPYNSLTLIADESNVLTFRKSASNDIFITAGYDELGYSSKEEAINDLKTKLFKATGGGSESGITSGDVQTMIDASLEDYYTDDEVDAALSGKASASDVAALQNEVAAKADTATTYTKTEVDTALGNKADTSAVTAVANDVQTVSGQVATKVNTTDFSAYSAATDARIAEDEEVTAAALNNLNENKLDVTAYTPTDLSNYYTKQETNGVVNGAVSGKADTSAVTAHTADTTVHVTSAEKTAWNAKQDALYVYTENRNTGTAELHSNYSSLVFSAGGTSITTNTMLGINTFNVASTGVTINNERVLTEGDVTSAITSASTNDEVAGAKAVYDAIQAGGGSSVTVDQTLDTGSTNPVANSAITTAIDNAKAYYISFATIATTGIRDEDWDGIVAAIDAHRPIYAGYPRDDGGILYYGVECMNKNSNNTQIILTSSDDSVHYFYTFTKNGSNDYTFTSETRPYVTDAEKTAWNAKQDALSAGTGIEISGNVISATGGGGATYSAGTNISIDTANTINCTLNARNGTGANSLIIGNEYCEVYGSYSLGIGERVNVGGGKSNSLVVGLQSSAYGSTAQAMGRNVVSNNDFEHSTGRYNNSTRTNTTFGDSGNTLLSVGNGHYKNGAHNHNALEIRQNGDIYFPDTDNTTYQNYYEKPMVRLQDMYGALGGLKLVKLTQAEYDALVSGGTVDSSTIYFITNVVS